MLGWMQKRIQIIIKPLLNTQVVYHVDKFRVFFYWSRDHGPGMKTSY